MRILLDTNVLIAAFVSRGGCHDLLEHCGRVHRLVTCRALVQEFEEKLVRKFKVHPDRVSEVAGLINSQFEMIPPRPLPAPVCRDPDDDIVLAAALSGSCDCIVTGDKDLLVIGDYQGIPILKPSAWWAFEARFIDEQRRGSDPRSWNSQ